MILKKMKKQIENIMYILLNYNFGSVRELRAYKNICGENRISNDISRVWPVNGNYERIFGDIFACRKILENEFNFPKQIVRVATVMKEKEYRKILSSSESTISAEDVRRLIDTNKSIVIRKSRNSISTEIHSVFCTDRGYILDGILIGTDKLNQFIQDLPSGTLIYNKKTVSDELKKYTGYDEPVFHIACINTAEFKIQEMYYAEHMNDGILRPYAFEISSKPVMNTIVTMKAIDAFSRIIKTFPDLKYINVAFGIYDNDYQILQIDTGLDLFFDNREKSAIRDSFINIKKTKKSILELLARYGFSVIANKKGFLDYMYRYWLKSVVEDFKTCKCGIRKFIWANRKGFYSYRLHQYGITPDNYGNFLSDRDYKRLRPINSEYYRLFTDKLITYYALSGRFKEYLAEHYCKIVNDGHNLKVYDIHDSGCTSINHIISLLKRKRKLICKKIIGSHGEGFIKLEYLDEKNILINNCMHRIDKVKEYLSKDKCSYIVTEYIEMHSRLRKICGDITCTIRIMTINIGNGDEIIKDAYFKIATKKTGITDNVSRGGIVAKIDLHSGHIYNPELLENHVYSPCRVHPDNSSEIEGHIPHWNLIKEKVSRIAEYLAELEYLGMDVVVTEDGFKLLEINTHQDLHKYNEYSDDIKNYFRHYLMGGQ